MITRIEIDGFKSFMDFQLDVPPFLVLVGPNAGGKSNFLDAVAFLRDAMTGDSHPLLNAARGRPHELFHRPHRDRPVELLDIEVDAIVGTGQHGGLPLHCGVIATWTEGQPPKMSDWHLGQMSEEQFASLPALLAERLQPPTFVNELLATKEQAESRSFLVSAIEEAKSWNLLVPDPTAMRRSVPSADLRPLTEDAGNLAAVLGRLKGTGVLAELVVDLVALVPDVTGVEPVHDERDEVWSFDLLIDHQPVPGRLASDGTLRVLALLTALYDPLRKGVLLIEELENGLHPSRLKELLRRIRRHVPDFADAGSMVFPLQQIIVTSHSPVVVADLYRSHPESLVFMDAAWRAGGGVRQCRISVARPIRESGEPGTFVSPRRVQAGCAAGADQGDGGVDARGS